MKKVYLLVIISLFFASHPRLLSDASAAGTGEPAPSFTAKTLDGEDFNLESAKDKVVVLEWFNDGCPFVMKHYRDGAMQALQKEYIGKGVVWVTINSTTDTHRDFRNETQLQALADKLGIGSSELIIDRSGSIGQSYGAKTTPHMFIISKGTLQYQGAIDDAPDVSSDPKAANNYVKKALDEILEGKTPSNPETKAYGCSIKYAS